MDLIKTNHVNFRSFGKEKYTTDVPYEEKMVKEIRRKHGAQQKRDFLITQKNQRPGGSVIKSVPTMKVFIYTNDLYHNMFLYESRISRS